MGDCGDDKAFARTFLCDTTSGPTLRTVWANPQARKPNAKPQAKLAGIGVGPLFDRNRFLRSDVASGLSLALGHRAAPPRIYLMPSFSFVVRIP